MRRLGWTGGTLAGARFGVWDMSLGVPLWDQCGGHSLGSVIFTPGTNVIRVGILDIPR